MGERIGVRKVPAAVLVRAGEAEGLASWIREGERGKSGFGGHAPNPNLEEASEGAKEGRSV
jgi:hypothetical protein